MDNNYYQNYLKYLYESSDNKSSAVYNVDTLLFSYTNSSTIPTNIDLKSFFNKVTGITYRSENAVDVQNRLNAPDGSKYSPLPLGNSFGDDAPNYEVKLEVARGNVMDPSVIKSIVDETTTIINNEMRTNDIVRNSNDITKSHKAFDNYMRGILNAVSTQMMISSMRFLYPITGVTKVGPALDDAVTTVVNGLSSSKKRNAIDLVSGVVQKTLADILAPMQNIRTDIMIDFNNNSSGFTSPLFYLLRSKSISNLYFPPNILSEDNDQVLIYIKKVMVDMYMRLSFPVLHYDFIDGLMKKYAASGDFVNVRIALLAKIFLTYYFVSYIYDNIFIPNEQSLAPDVAKSYRSTLDNIQSKLNSYLTSINNIDVSGSPGKNPLGDIITELHKLSSDVVVQSKDINGVKEEIQTNQLALRNLISNLELMRSDYDGKVSKFWIVFGMIIGLVLLAGALMFIKRPTWVYYVVGLMIIILLIIKLVELIKYFLAKN